MDFQELISRYFPFVKRNLLVLSLGALGVIFFVYGLIGLFLSNKSASDEIVFSSEKNLVETKTIMVDIEGAVVKQGLYELPLNSRIQDSLVAAGGLSAQADREYVAKNLNLATKLTDGAKIYIPKEGEAKGITGTTGITGSTQALNGQININTASESELDTLSGVGPVTARKIIAARPYTSVGELLSKKIVGNKVYEQIKDKITVY